MIKCLQLFDVLLLFFLYTGQILLVCRTAKVIPFHENSSNPLNQTIRIYMLNLQNDKRTLADKFYGRHQFSKEISFSQYTIL